MLVNSPRTEHLIRLEQGNRSTANSVGVRNRMPQGQLVPFSFSGADVFDDTDTMDVFLFVPSRMYILIECRAMIRFREFFASAKSVASASSGSLTSDSGGGSTSGSGGSSTDTTASGNHSHRIGTVGSDAGALTMHDTSGISGHIRVETGFTGEWNTSPEGLPGYGHTHDVTVPARTHSTPNHAHTVPGHTHALTVTYGVIKETYPTSHSVPVKVYELVGSAWTLRGTTAAIVTDTMDLDLTGYVTGPGAWRLEFKSDAGQPNGGRLGCDVAGYALGAIQSS